MRDYAREPVGEAYQRAWLVGLRPAPCRYPRAVPSGSARRCTAPLAGCGCRTTPTTPPSATQRRGDRHAQVEAVQRGLLRRRALSACACAGGQPRVRRAPERQPLGLRARAARAAAPSRTPARRPSRLATNEAATAAPTRRRAEQPGDARDRVVDARGDARLRRSPRRRAPPPSAARRSSTARARTPAAPGSTSEA